MPDDSPDPAAAPREPDIDENGVDLAQLRAMLDLTPAERLARVTAFMNALLALRPRSDRPGSA
jgi:hypothetical protein